MTSNVLDLSEKTNLHEQRHTTSTFDYRYRYRHSFMQRVVKDQLVLCLRRQCVRSRCVSAYCSRKKQGLTSLTTDGGPISPACTVLWMPLFSASCQQQTPLCKFKPLTCWILESDWSEDKCSITATLTAAGCKL